MAFNFDLGSVLGGAISGVGSLFGGSVAADNARELQEKNIEAQREFAQNGVRWRVADAKAAGIHPLYALGATTPTFSPVSGYIGDYGISDAARSFGQGIDRAVQVGMTREEREQSRLQQEFLNYARLAEFERQGRESDANLRLIDSQIALNEANSIRALTSAAPSPAMPSSPSFIPGQGDSGNMDKPVSMYGFAKNDEGKFMEVIPGQDYKQVFEDTPAEMYPLLRSGFVDFLAKVFGVPVDGYYWHGSDEGYKKGRPPSRMSSAARGFLRGSGTRSF